MRRQIYILTLLGIFFLSTTGLPLTINICNMNKTRSVKQCEMLMDMMKIGKCHEENSISKVNISSSLPACCQIKIVDNRVTDNFIFTHTDIGTKFSVKVIIISGFLNQIPEINFEHNFYSSGSPPLLSDNHLYLTNSILLI